MRHTDPLNTLYHSKNTIKNKKFITSIISKSNIKLCCISHYRVQKIRMSSVEVLVKKLLFIETLPAVTALPLVYIHVDLVLFLISVEVVIRMESTLVWNLVSFSFHKRRQVLQRTNPNLYKRSEMLNI